MTRYEPFGTSSEVANALHSGGKRHNKIEPASIDPFAEAKRQLGQDYIPEPPEPLYAPTPRCLRPCRQLVQIDTRGRRRRCNRPCKRSNRHTDPYCDCLWHFPFVPKYPTFPSPPDVHKDLGLSKEQAIKTAKQLLERYERLDTEEKIDLANDVKVAFAPPEISKDDPAYTTAPADFSTCEEQCAGGCGFKAAKDKSFEGYCCGKCWYYANDPNAGKNKKHCRRCAREWYQGTEDDTSTTCETSATSEVSDTETESSLTETSECRSYPECTNCQKPLKDIESMRSCATCKILCCINCTVFHGLFKGPYCFRCAEANKGRVNDIEDTGQPCDAADGETPYSLQYVCRHGRHRSPVISQALTDLRAAEDEPDDDDAEDSPEDQEEDYPGPPKCRCRCGCQDKPESRIQCRWCNRFVGPECCVSTPIQIPVMSA